MGVTFAVLLGFIGAASVPLLNRVAHPWSGWLLPLLPLGLTAYFGSFISPIIAGQVIIIEFAWVPSLGVNLSFYIDGLSLLFALLITGIGTLVVLYAGYYLHEHPNIGRFNCVILMFLASMLGLVLAGNLLTLFVFWELTSITSYLLIGFDHHREKARQAALQALLVTGGGGLALLAGLVLLGMAGGSFEIPHLLAQGEFLRDHFLALPIMVLIFIGAFTKSAQVPFHFWLPNAMEAPTPVSAYLHSATMVKAGVYLLARMNPIFSDTDLWLYVVTSVGAVTMVTGALMALGQSDLKRILAYSTVSMLGMLTMLLGLGTELAIKAAVVVLLAHALYKATLFLISGSIDHESGTRDVNYLGGLRRSMPITAATAWLAAASMASLPPLAGFLGKETLYEGALDAETGPLLLIGASVLASVVMTALACLVAIRPFFGGEKATPKHPHEAPLQLWIGPVILAVLGLFIGLLPGPTIEPFLSATSAAILGVEIVPIHFALWHGFNIVVALTIATIAGGVLIYAQLPRVLRTGARAAVMTRRGPEYVYDLAVEGMNQVAVLQTRVLQNGYLRHYIATAISATVVVVGITLLWQGRLAWPDTWTDVRFYEVGLGALIVVAAISAAALRSIFAAAIALGVTGYGVAALFIFFGAPDLAMTQILVETLTVVLFLLVFYHFPPPSRLSNKRTVLRDAALALGGGVLMTALVLVALNVQFEPSISDYFGEQSVPVAHGRNVVNVILVDFRALDTLGEIIVLGIAAIGAYALLKSRRDRG